MSQDRWTQVDDYLSELFIPRDPALEAAITDSKNAGLPAIQVAPTHGKLLHLLARIRGAKNVLEIGTLGGYSSIWLARALPAGGRVISLELDPKHAEVARKNIARAGLEAVVEVRLGAALETLPALEREQREPFDFVFIDADKANIPRYFDWALKLTRRGSVIVVDNVIRKGAVADARSTDENVLGVRRFNEQFAGDPRVTITVIQTVGSKGYDGLAIALVTGA
jgi:predicted O-methyltransferase YrrM